MEAQIQYARTEDGVSIAFTRFGIVQKCFDDALRLYEVRWRE